MKWKFGTLNGAVRVIYLLSSFGCFVWEPAERGRKNVELLLSIGLVYKDKMSSATLLTIKRKKKISKRSEPQACAHYGP
jgi:hypothetical protein